MSPVLRLFFAAYLTDASLYLAFAALPFRALDLGAGPTGLGILPTLYAVAYMTTASLAGRLSDRVSRLRLARAGGALFLVGCLALSRAPSLAWLDLGLPVLGLGLGFFWSPVQAALADRAGAMPLSRAVTGFNVAWSLGKGSGLVAGGLLTESLGPERALLVAGLPMILTLVLLPRERTGRSPVGPPAGEPRAEAGPAAPEPSARFVRIAWMTNAIAFGIGSSLNVHAPKLLISRGAGPSEFGFVVGAVFLAQTATFLALADHHPRRRGLFLAYGAGIAALLGFLVAPGFGARLLAVLPLGICLGVAYQTSIHASLDRARGRGRAAGLHETLLGAGSSSLPLLGGAAATLSGSLTAPFLVGAVALGLGLALTAFLVRSR